MEEYVEPVRDRPKSGEELIQDAIDASCCDPFAEAQDYLDKVANPKSLFD